MDHTSGAPSGSSRLRAAAIAALPLLGLASAAADAPTGGDRSQRAFILSNIYIAASPETGVCEPVAAGGLESFLASLSPAEQALYASPGKRAELEKLMGQRLGFRRVALRGNPARTASLKLPDGYQAGSTPSAAQARALAELNGFPRGKGRLAFQNQVLAYDSCTDPADFRALARGYRTYDGSVAFGMDLDGKTSRASFATPEGAKGVDNQLWRAIGCVAPFRESGRPDIARNILFSARAPTLITISGIDDPHDDPDVLVTIEASADALAKDATGRPLAGATFDAERRPDLRTQTHGRIVDGILTTEPADFVLNYKEQILDAPRILRGARIRARLLDDGTIEGGFYGYYTLASFYNSIEQMTVNGANLSRVSCPGVRQAIDKLADGYRDPKTRRFTAISSALGFYGVAAFRSGAGDAPTKASIAR